MLTYNYNEKEYQYISDNNIVYSLYEGVSMPDLYDSDNRKSSDIVFIMLDGYAEQDIRAYCVNYVYGAEFLGKDKEMEESIKYYVGRFEEEHKDLIESIKKSLDV